MATNQGKRAGSHYFLPSARLTVLIAIFQPPSPSRISILRDCHGGRAQRAARNRSRCWFCTMPGGPSSRRGGSKKFEESRSFVRFVLSQSAEHARFRRSLARRAIIGDFRFCRSAGLCMTYFALNGAEREVLEPAAAVYGRNRRRRDRQHALIEFIR